MEYHAREVLLPPNMKKEFWYARFAYNILHGVTTGNLPGHATVIKRDGGLASYGDWKAQQKSSSKAKIEHHSTSNDGFIPAIGPPVASAPSSGDPVEEIKEDLENQKRLMPWMGKFRGSDCVLAHKSLTICRA